MLWEAIENRIKRISGRFVRTPASVGASQRMSEGKKRQKCVCIHANPFGFQRRNNKEIEIQENAKRQGAQQWWSMTQRGLNVDTLTQNALCETHMVPTFRWACETWNMLLWHVATSFRSIKLRTCVWMKDQVGAFSNPKSRRVWMLSVMWGIHTAVRKLFLISKKWPVPGEGSHRFTELYHTDITPAECLPGTVQHWAANDDLSLVSAIKKQKPEPN